MNSNHFWIGLLPILAYVVLDSFAGKKSALMGALLLGLLELGFSLIFASGIDYITIISFLILGLFIYFSFRFKSDFYFKIQGAVVNGIVATILLIGKYVFHRNILLDIFHKYYGMEKALQSNSRLNEALITGFFDKAASQLPWWLVGHALLTVYSALKWSKWAWLGVRVPLFYLLLFFAGMFMRP